MTTITIKLEVETETKADSYVIVGQIADALASIRHTDIDISVGDAVAAPMKKRTYTRKANSPASAPAGQLDIEQIAR